MVASAITAFCSTHITGSNENTRGSGVGEFIASSDVLSISADFRNCNIVLRARHVQILNAYLQLPRYCFSISYYMVVN